MGRLIIRKLLLMIVILAILNYVAYHYALRHPAMFNFPFTNIPNPDAQALESQYPAYARGLLRGELGTAEGTPVEEIIREPIKNSLILVGVSLAITVVAGLALGFLAVSPTTWRVRPWGVILLSAGSSMPGFILGAILLSLLVYQLLFTGSGTTLLPISGFGLDEHLILPVIVLAMQPTFHLAKVTTGLLENELQQDYIQVANSRGLNWPQLVRRHAWPNMLSPTLVAISEGMRLMIGALVIVEAVFLWPGIGRIFLYTVGLRLDAGPTGTLFGSPELIAILVVILGSWLLIADLLAAVLAYRFDPRVRVALERNDAVAA
jgi:peptide/nickel transport system permease protein